MAWSLELQDDLPCFDSNNCVTHDDALLNRDVKFAYVLLMIAHFVSSVIHFVITRISVASNAADNDSFSTSSFNKLAYFRKYLLIIKIFVIFSSVTNAQVILVNIKSK